MTEAEWWVATDPRHLVDWLFFDAWASYRKLRLFSVTACEPLRRLVRDTGVLAALDSAEAFADGQITTAKLDAVNAIEWQNFHARESSNPDRSSETFATIWMAEVICLYPSSRDPHRDRDDYQRNDATPYPLTVAQYIDHPRERAHFPRLVHFLHDIFGPLPFRDVAVAPAWLTSDVLALAKGIYDEKAFDRMPIVADALQDAGCDSDDILNHCRAAGWEHVRGCWVIDLLLGKPWREAVPAPG